MFRPELKQWIRYNDSNVSHVEKAKVLYASQGDACLMLYTYAPKKN